MRKDQLRKLRTLNATPAMIKKAREEIQDDRYTRGEHALYLRCQCLKGILKIAVFPQWLLKHGERAPSFEIFISPEAEQFITRYYKNGRELWSEAMICNLPYPLQKTQWCLINGYREHAWINKEGCQTIKRMLKTEKSGYLGILKYQQQIRAQDLAAKRARETKPWDEDMALIPKLPEGFRRFWQKESIREHFIFYHYKRGGADHGYCSYCEREVPIIKPLHNKKATCLRCKREITYKSSGKIGTLGTDLYRSQIIQEIKGGVVIRGFYVKKAYKGDYTKPEYTISEHERCLWMADGKIRYYQYEDYKQTGMRWCRGDYGIYIGSYLTWDRIAPLYPGTLKKLERGALKRSALPILARKKIRVNASAYLYKERKLPKLEQIIKAGLLNLGIEIAANERKYKEEIGDSPELAKALGIDNARLKRLREADGNCNMLQWLKKEKQADTKWPDEMIGYFVKHNIRTEDLNFISGKMSYQKIWHYILRQSEKSGDMAGAVINTWRDYLGMAESLKMITANEQIYKPADLKARHDELVLIKSRASIKKQAEEKRKQYPLVDEICKELKKYEYAGKKYCIVAPKGVEDIVLEGTLLRHCIHTAPYYFERISAKETFILFLRRKETPDNPWYTLEVQPNLVIRQKRTTGDNQNADFEDCVGFLKEWQKEIKKRLSKEDEELGKQSDKLRQQEYAKLRKDGNRIWHGKLAGKLLADVLEADLMEAI